ncbi:membrane protein [Bacillus phage Bcp1]|uniref:Putative membrane protein n=1 Tax=Bacillus phage Bcp1 TaxID=584892 RepID=X2JUQ0_9CAUD|nr:membrane protein [Bacillus phage Bcp1]AHN66651.1 putative membrane protein [Bacillus phage Bcp1]
MNSSDKFSGIFQIIATLLLGCTIVFNLSTGAPVFGWVYVVFVLSFIWMLLGNPMFTERFPYFKNLLKRKGE